MFDIKSVTMIDFRSYQGHHSFTFPTSPGLYYLTGRNDAHPRLGANATGKSTLLEAIHWCLYGHTSRGLKAGDVVAKGERSCEVSVLVEVAGVTTAITRVQAPNKLTLAGSPVSQEELEKFLRLGPTAFSYAVMLPQFGESFFDLKPTDKLALFSQIMELDFWLERSAEAAKLAKELEADKHKAERDLSTYTGQITLSENDIAVYEEQSEGFDKKLDATIRNLKTQAKELVIAQKQLSAEYTNAVQAVKLAESKLAAHSKKAAVCPTCKQPVRDEIHATLTRNVEDFTNQVRSIDRRRDLNSQRMGNLESEITTEAARENPYAKMIETKRVQITQLKRGVIAIEDHIKGINEDHAAVTYWVGGFKRVRLFVVEEALQQLEIEVNNNLAALGLLEWEVKFDVERENKSGGLTKGFMVFVHPPGHAEPMRFEAYSGGETQRLRLAGDLGLSNLIMERAGLTGTIEFYDEPSSHLSTGGLLDLCETLHQRALDQDKRVWVVDHHAMEFGDFAGQLTAIMTPKGSQLAYTG